MSFNKDNKVNNGHSSISIGLASPEEILAQSSGEVLKPETINSVSYTHLEHAACQSAGAGGESGC